MSKSLRLPIIYAVVAILVVVAYPFAQALMATNYPWFYIIQSNITLNFVILFFLWGVVSDIYTKGKSKKTQWIVFAVGLIALVLFFKVIGKFPTIF